MSCPRHEDVSAYMDDMMAPAERPHFALHLKECAACRERLDVLEALRDDLQAMPSPVLGYDLAAQFDERLRTRGARRMPARTSWFGWGAGGLAVAFSLTVGVWLGGVLAGAAVVAPPVGVARVFDPVPPGGLCAAPELCRLSRGMQ
ncbi:zf-HC2 domain-containing protein [Herbaspirillum sp. HC18]|nr:zf-HC2 domain-containing protein [Herbaspirillum sp. HC18]